MDRGTDIEVLKAALNWLTQDHNVILITVVSSFGSSPRQPGAMMAIHPEGKFVGSVSGGCIEDDLLQKQFIGEFSESTPRFIEYGANSEQAQRVGLPCGGSIKLLVEKLEPATQLSALIKLVESIQSRHLIKRQVCINTGEVNLHKINFPRSNEPEFIFTAEYVIKVFGPQCRLMLIGAGELSHRVAELALTLDYEVIVCDPRTEYAHNWQLDDTVFKSGAVDKTVKQMNPDSKTAILALAHSPLLEDNAVAVALKSDAFYIGVLGSKNNARKLRERLISMGLDSKVIAQLHAPVGIDIGSKTPAEIAISVIADLIKVRNKLHTKRKSAKLSHV